MELKMDRKCTAFADAKKIASGNILEVAIKVKKYLSKDNKDQILIFDDATSNQVEIDFRGTPDSVTRRLESLMKKTESEEDRKSGPGRPKLGVVAKEVTLLPEHWEWLSRQSGGASVTLRKLVEEAKKKNFAKDQIRLSQEATYKFMMVMAGDRPQYEEALRALYAGDSRKFEKLVQEWPEDIQVHVLKLAKGSWK